MRRHRVLVEIKCSGDRQAAGDGPKRRFNVGSILHDIMVATHKHAAKVADYVGSIKQPQGDDRAGSKSHDRAFLTSCDYPVDHNLDQGINHVFRAGKSTS